MPALTFTGGDTDAVSLGTAASLSNLATGTVMVLQKASALQRGRGIFGKGVPASANNTWFNTSGGADQILFQIARATSGFLILANWTDLPGYAADKWVWLVASWNLGGASTDQLFYSGRITSQIQPVTTYVVRNMGSGAAGNNSANAAYLGSLSGGATESWPGQIACGLVWNRQLSLADIRRHARRLPVTQGGGLLGAWCLGDRSGTGIQYDRSAYGNHGTVTGATFARAPELDWLFRPDSSPRLELAVAPAVTAKPWLYYARQRGQAA